MCENFKDQYFFKSSKENLLFIADMHDYLILSDQDGNEIYYDTAEEAITYSEYLNEQNIKGLRTKAISFPHRIYMISWQD